MTPQALMPALFAPLILFALYRRFRRNFGRQPIQRKRMNTRIGLSAVVLALFVLPAANHTEPLAAALIGMALGAALAVLGLRLTKFETTAEGQEFYTPNTYIGVLLTAVLVARLVYRFFVLYSASPQLSAAAAGGDPFANLSRSPLTLGILTMLIAYYLVYYLGILREGRRHGVA